MQAVSVESRDPSGDHLGARILPLDSMRVVRPEPSALTRKSEQPVLSPCSHWQPTSLLPSGDQSGREHQMVSAIRTALPPSASVTHMSPAAIVAVS